MDTFNVAPVYTLMPFCVVELGEIKSKVTLLVLVPFDASVPLTIREDPFKKFNLAPG